MGFLSLSLGFFTRTAMREVAENVYYGVLFVLFNLVIYTGDSVPGDQIIREAKQRFNVHINENVQFCHLKKRRWVEAACYPFFTLLGQSLGSVVLGFEALWKLVPDVYIDTMGYAFTYPLFRHFGQCQVGCYVHYPTISSDMLGKVSSRSASFNNNPVIARSAVLTYFKLTYYRLFAALYGWVGKQAHAVLVNSSWTEGHINDIWDIPWHAENGQEDIKIIAVAQFRPEKDHPLMLRSFFQFVNSLPEDRRGRVRLLLVGSCRHEEDYQRVDDYKKLSGHLAIDDKVEFHLNVDFNELKRLMQIPLKRENGGLKRKNEGKTEISKYEHVIFKQYTAEYLNGLRTNTDETACFNLDGLKQKFLGAVDSDVIDLLWVETNGHGYSVHQMLLEMCGAVEPHKNIQANPWQNFSFSHGSSSAGPSVTKSTAVAGPSPIANPEKPLGKFVGNYNFRPEDLQTAHCWNQKRAAKKLEEGVSPVIIDNTNLEAWEMKPYVDMGVVNNYRVELLEPETPWRQDARVLAQKNRHGVPREKIRQMLDKLRLPVDINSLVEEVKIKRGLLGRPPVLSYPPPLIPYPPPQFTAPPKIQRTAITAAVDKKQASGKLTLDKGCNTEEVNDEEDVASRKALSILSSYFPLAKTADLADVLEKCLGNLNWAVDLLLDSGYECAKDVINEIADLEENKDEETGSVEAIAVHSSISQQETEVSDTNTEETKENVEVDASRRGEEAENLKRELENCFTLNDSISDHARRICGKEYNKFRASQIQKARRGAKMPQPGSVTRSESLPEMIEAAGGAEAVETDSVAVKLEEEVKEESTEAMIPICLDPQFTQQLISLFGVPETATQGSEDLQFEIPWSLAEQIYSHWCASLACRNSSAPQTEENDPVPNENDAAFQTIMDMEYALQLAEDEKNAERREQRNSLATKLSMQMLRDAYPEIDPLALEALFEAHDYNYNHTVSALNASLETRNSPSVSEPKANCIEAPPRDEPSRRYAELYREANGKAGLQIIAEKNAQADEKTIDLHQLHVKEALSYLESFIAEVSRDGKTVVTVITGQGNHSINGRARIKPAVEAFLCQKKYRFYELNPGALRVYLKR
nr:EOG090X07J8 [Eulimnadia texana]